MKKFTLIVCAAMFSAATFSQTFTCPISIKRANGGGGCSGGGTLTLGYASCPSIAMRIDSVYSNGSLVDVTFGAGVITCGSKNEVKYCFGPGSLPPANTLKVYFQGGGTYDGTTCTIPSTGGPLPVTLSYFTAARKSGTVLLQWETNTEVNTREFLVQRRNGNLFETVGIIPAANIFTGSRYHFTDNNTSKGITEYQLLMVDNDGKSAKSDIRIIKGVSAGTSDITIYPNPSSGTATVLLDESIEKAQLQVIDNSGKMLRKTNFSGNTTTLNLLPGLYLVRVINTVTGVSTIKKLSVIK